MSDYDPLREALGALLLDQPPAPDRVSAVRSRIRRRAQVRAAAAVVAAAVAVTGVAVLLPGRAAHRAQPARPATGPFLPWAPRYVGTGSQAGLRAAEDAWNGGQTGGPLSDLHELYAGVPDGQRTQWVVFEATRLNPPAASLAGPRLVVAKTSGYPSFTATLVADVPAPDPAVTDSVSIVEQRVDHGYYVGQPGSTDRTTVFALPAPDRHLTVRAVQGPRPRAGVAVDGPTVLSWSGVAAPIQVSSDGATWHRAGLPLVELVTVSVTDDKGHISQVEQPPTARLAPTVAPSGFVQANAIAGDSGGAANFSLGRTTLRLLARCTTYGTEPLHVVVTTTSGSDTASVPCDGGVHQLGDDVAVLPGTVGLAPSLDSAVDELFVGAYVPVSDAARLGVRTFR